MKSKFPKISIGLRTIKTALAVILSLIVIDILGAMSAVQPTYKESLEALEL